MMISKWRKERKTVSGISLTLLLVGLLTVIPNIGPAKSQPKMWTVDDDGPADFSKIQDAINAASSGDSINVSSGIYCENIAVDKTLYIFGKSRKTTFVSGNGTGTVVSVTANNVNISEFTIKDSGTLIPELDSGIYVSSTGNRFERNIIANTSNGIYLSSSSNFLSGNIIVNSTSCGVKFVHASGNMLIDNTVENNSRGIFSYSSSGNIIYHNSFINNTVKQVEYAHLDRKDTWYDVYPYGGNYWDDYTGVDVNKSSNQDQPGSDGIGDTNYTINADNIDRYPLMLVVHNINTGLNYSRIQEAIDSEDTQNGNTLRVDNVTRYEHVILSKSVTLIGQRMNETIIDGSGTGTALKIEASNVTITGFTIQNSEYGIDVSSSSNNITDNIIKDNDYGIKLSSSSNNLLRKNNITGNQYNFYVEGSKLPHFINDIDTSNRVDGKPIYYYVNNESLIINPSTHLQVGYLGLVNCKNITVQNLTLMKNGQGLLLAFTNGSAITGMNISNNLYGIKLLSASNNIVNGSNVVNGVYGIVLSSSSSNTFVNNTITDTSFGMSLSSYSSGNNLIGNNITNARVGISLSRSFNNTIKWNNITMLTKIGTYGIYLSLSFNNTADGNSVTGCYLGVDLLESNDIIISSNCITNNYIGIFLEEQASSNTIERNNITNNNSGIYADAQSSSNRIFHNNFINNKNPCTGTANQWDNDWPSGGNYWSDNPNFVDEFRGTHKPYETQNQPGSDGIVDTHHPQAPPIDDYPLMKPYCGEHDIVIRNVTMVIENVIMPRAVLMSGYNPNITIKVVNYGIHDETFLLSAYNETFFDPTFIGSKNVTTSYRNSSTTIFTWNTAGLSYGKYTIKVNATQVSGEWNTTDNTWIGNVTITGEGDLTGDFVVDGQDVVLVIEAIPSYPGHPKWKNPLADLTGDNVVDGQDAIKCIELMLTQYK